MLTYDEIMKERREFIGPPLPPQSPKMQPKLTPKDEHELEGYADELVRKDLEQQLDRVDRQKDPAAWEALAASLARLPRQEEDTTPPQQTT